MEIGNNLKKLRAKKDMTQKELAEALNVSYQAVSRWENNEVEPDISTLSKLSQIFGVSVDEIINGEVEKPKEEPKQAEVAAVASMVAASKEEKKIVKYCYSCHKPIYEGDAVKQINRMFPDGHVEAHDICVKCFNEKNVEEKVKCEICGKEVPKSSSKRIAYSHTVRQGRHHVKKHTYKNVCSDCCSAQLAGGKATIATTEMAKPTGSLAVAKKQKEPMGGKRLIFGLIFGIVTLIALMIVFFTVTSMSPAAAIFVPILLGYGVFATIYCLFTDCFIGDLFIDVASFSIKMPGIIFTFDLDGFAFLIVMKILFAIIGFFIGITVFLLAVALSMFFSIFTFPFVAHRDSI